MTNALPEIPQALRDLMAEVGPRWGTNPAAHVKLMVEHFSEVLKLAPTDGATVRRTMAYGGHQRQYFDLFKPSGQSTPRPIVVFVHGGAFLAPVSSRNAQI